MFVEYHMEKLATHSLQNRGLLPINVQDYSDGLYMISLIVEGKPMENIKFNVTH